MKRSFIILAVIATAYASLPSSEYLPPSDDDSAASNIDLQSIAESSPLEDDGYRYKTVKRLRFRHRRDVNELPSSEYLPPTQSGGAVADIPVAPAASGQDSAVLSADGYRYKTLKRIRYRHRRSVSELPSSEYLPPTEGGQGAASEDSAVLADDGYRYKTLRRLRYRHRRDVSELPSSEYLPPNEYLPPTQGSENVQGAASGDSAVLANDGYRYKTLKRIRYRHRRSVSELPSSEYLPPTEGGQGAASEESAVLADDGYRYKTLRRLRYRHRRDVSELPSSEYLPPNEYLPPTQGSENVQGAASGDSAVLANDGYRYKTLKRIRYRHRRSVSELPSSEYLPPTEGGQGAASEESAVLADDGYRYKTLRRLRYRHRRDVSELPSSEYLPPNEYLPPTQGSENVQGAASGDSAVLAADGYRYKTLRRLRYRHRRDVSELPSSEYLPPNEYLPPTQGSENVQGAASGDSAVLAADGYRYKTLKRIRYRHRRQANEVPSNENSSPAEEST